MLDVDVSAREHLGDGIYLAQGEITSAIEAVTTTVGRYPFQWTPLSICLAGRRPADDALIGTAAVFIAGERYEYAIFAFAVHHTDGGAVAAVDLEQELANAFDIADASRKAAELAAQLR